jgi:hypothetical protein
MGKVFSAHAVSVDGYISGRAPDGDEEFGRGLGDAPMLFDWYTNGDTPSQVFDGFKPSAGRSFFHELSEHVHLRLPEAVPAPGVIHLRYEVVR